VESRVYVVVAAKMAMGHHTFGGGRLQAFSDAVFAIVATIMVRRSVGLLYTHAVVKACHCGGLVM